MFVDIIIVFIL